MGVLKVRQRQLRDREGREPRRWRDAATRDIDVVGHSGAFPAEYD